MIRAHILPMFLRNIAIKGELQRIAKVAETVGNKGKAAISGGLLSSLSLPELRARINQ